MLEENTAGRVDFWFDVLCPWCWITSRWITEVSEVRPIEVNFQLMSLAVLNEGKDLPEPYHSKMPKSWFAGKVIAAAQEHSGEQIIAQLYAAIGHRIHNEQREVKEAVIGGLAECGLPAELIAAGETETFGDAVRKSHQRAIDLVGTEVGTPVIALNGVGFFGPVLSKIPRGETAGELFDAAVTLAKYPHFYELKRTRNEEPDFS